MDDFKQLVDLFVTCILNVFNALRDGMGFWFFVWIVTVFIMPWFRKLIKTLRS